MANTPSRQTTRVGAPGIVILLFGLALFALVIFLEYTHGTKRGDLFGSIIYAIPFSFLLTGGLFGLTAGSVDVRQKHVPWHRQKFILLSLLSFSLCLVNSTLLVNSFMGNTLPDAVGLPIGIVGFLLAVVFFVQFMRVRNT
jgi:hypothetical protein